MHLYLSHEQFMKGTRRFVLALVVYLFSVFHTLSLNAQCTSDKIIINKDTVLIYEKKANPYIHKVVGSDNRITIKKIECHE